MYNILIIDYDEAIYAEVYSDGEIKKVWHETSTVPKKHHKGGQSAPRYARIRELEIVLWFKKLNELMKLDGSDIYLGISNIYYNAFKKKLSTYNLNKIKYQTANEYNGITGVYQMISKLNKQKSI